MPAFQRNKSVYVQCLIDDSERCLTNGTFAIWLKQSHNMSVEEYIRKYESESIPKCKCSDFCVYRGFNKAEGKWQFFKDCGKPECRAITTAESFKNSFTPERNKRMIETTKQTFLKDPERKARAIAKSREGNMKIGPDGLSGYQKTAIKRAQTLQEKYGHPAYANWEKTKNTIKNWSDEQRNQNSINRSNGLMARSKEAKKESVKKAKETSIKNNGKPAWEIAYLNSTGRRSKIADKFCQEVQALIPETPLTFGTKEFNISNKYYDLANCKTKKIVEFNGDFWHANPKKYSALDIIGIRHKNVVASVIWEEDAKKIALAENEGYQVKVIWESEYRKNPDAVSRQVAEWLADNNQGE